MTGKELQAMTDDEFAAFVRSSGIKTASDGGRLMGEETRALPLTAEEEAKFRESVLLLGQEERVIVPQWTNWAVNRLLATLDADRARLSESASLDVERLARAINPQAFGVHPTRRTIDPDDFEWERERQRALDKARDIARMDATLRERKP